MTLSENPIYNRSCIFAKEVIKAAKEIKQDTITKPMITQLIKCATSIGANVSEATYGASRKDFINKITIALKEGQEAAYWLDIL
ncbi:MAG: four helix bundle protein, partial [Patescibacteria group bacterium]